MEQGDPFLLWELEADSWRSRCLGQATEEGEGGEGR